VLGRAEECDVHVLDPSVSRRHVVISAGPPVTVLDVGSGNGSRLAGRALAPNVPTAFGAGDALEFGSAVALLAGAVAETAKADPMANAERLLTLAAPSSISVLFIGETGVGKSRAAARFHAASPRAKGPFIQVNCAAISASLMESEFFGHERGAFTGAVGVKVGLLQAANGGTLFLDEVGELPLELQAKLLQALETRQIRRVGGVASIDIDIRVLSATNRDIHREVSEGRFRADLFFRLNGMTVHLPALRDRPDEVVRLAREFLTEVGGQSFTSAAIRALRGHPWPGNARELRNVVERANVLSGTGKVDAEHLVLVQGNAPRESGGDAVDAAAAAAGDATLREHLARVERAHIEEALRATGGNQGRAAERLGISRRTLIERLEEYALPRPRKRVDR
jgi:DNA-binding NtrC family response regulator